MSCTISIRYATLRFVCARSDVSLQEDLVRSIEFAITSSTAPSELVHRLLNLAEFMEHEEKPLPIENRTLGEYATRFHAYAKALHYKELEFFTETSPTIIEALISSSKILSTRYRSSAYEVSALHQRNGTGSRSKWTRTRLATTRGK